VKGSTVFISYLAALSVPFSFSSSVFPQKLTLRPPHHSAHDTATERNHKTINATHVLDSVKQLMWDDGDELHKVLKKELAGSSLSLPTHSFLLPPY
jgi:DNA polymerase epsilon subunit 3